MFNYPDRVYFVKGSVDDEYIKGLAYNLANVNKSKGNDGKYVFIKINVNKIDDNVKFYYDPNYTYGFYTRNNIRPDCIDSVEEIDFSSF